MKNIHVLPTHKPSQLHLWTDENGSRLELCELEYSHTRNTQNIYITSDEEIKEGDWCIELNLGGKIIEVFKCKGMLSPESIIKKIILTTDQDLIKDGVQDIVSHFLEWFIKNPSCEFVKTKYIKTPDAVFRDRDVPYSYYQIIIPKEEQKQALIDMMKSDEESGLYDQEIKLEDIFNDEKRQGVKDLIDAHKQDDENYLDSFGVTKTQFEVYRNFNKQETLEEAVNAFKKTDVYINEIKQKQERRYSEEDMNDYANYRLLIKKALSPKEWFKQFKNK